MRPLDPLALPLHGTHLIEASAGTGKTYTITTLFVRLVAERGLRPDEVLVVTFTEAATAELRGRVRSRIRDVLADLATGCDDDPLVAALRADRDRVESRLHQALRDFDECAISTIHGFCRRTLLDNAFESGVTFDADISPDVAPLFQEIAEDFWSRELHDADPLLVRYLDGQTTSKLASLAADVVSQPDREVLPTHVEPVDAPTAFRHAHARARTLWLAHRSDVEALLATAPGLNRRSYTRATLPRWLSVVDAALEAADPGHPRLPDGVGRLTATTLAAKMAAGHPPPSHPCLDALDALVSAAALFEQQALGLRHRLATYARQQQRSLEQERNIHTFDDLLHKLDQALDGPGRRRLAAAIRRRHSAALIDEFQDTDRVQYRIFSRIYGDVDAPLFLIGDPKQSIYGFRGADIHAYLGAASDAGERRWTLDTNWRSDPSLLRAINVVFSRGDRPFLFERIEYSPVKPAPQADDALLVDGRRPPVLDLRFVRRDEHPGVYRNAITSGWARAELPAIIASEIARLLQSGVTRRGDPLRPADIAVLTRTNAQARSMQGPLRRLGIPSVLHSAGSVHRTHEAAEVYQLLSALADPASEDLARAALATDLLGVDAAHLWSLRRDDQAWDRWLERLDRWRDLWQQRGFHPMFRAVLDHGAPPAHARLLRLPDGERRLTNLLHLAELLHTTAAAEHLGTRGLLRWYDAQLSNEGTASDAAELRLESDEQAVEIVTIHKAKGLEYPVVFCPFLWTGAQMDKQPPVSFHDPQDGDRPKLDLGTDQLPDHAVIAYFGEMAETLRLAYVALTRAKHMTVVVCGAFTNLATSPLGYLLHRPAGATSADEVKRHLKGRSDTDLLADLQSLADAADGAIRVCDLDDLPAERYRPPRLMEAPPLVRPPPVRTLRPTRRRSSFSGLTAGAEASPLRVEGRDHDESTVVATGFPSGEPASPAHLLDVRGGRLLGTCVHAVFEDLDFGARDGLAALVGRKLRTFGLPSAWAGSIASAVDDTLDTAIDEGPRHLADISRSQRLDELPFILPATGMTPGALADVFAAHGGAFTRYAGDLAALDFPRLDGFLRGFIDLVFEHDGRWFLLDYKTNNLGPGLDDYTPPRLTESMIEHHYVLQYHLYALALHRLLGHRLDGYDYDAHFGGVYYLFIRGMTPQSGPARGVFRDRPPAALIQALCDLFDGGRCP